MAHKREGVVVSKQNERPIDCLIRVIVNTALTMPASMTGVIKRQTMDLKRRFVERAEERRKKRLSKEVAEMRSLDKHYLLRNASSEDTESRASSNMSTLLTASCIASSLSSIESSSKVNSLYDRTSTPEETQIIHPVIYKRDIYVPLNESSMNKPRGIETRGDKHNLDEAKTNLPPFSVSGSMLCREMEKGRMHHLVTTAPQYMMSPQKPIGLPANSIMASMLFRTLEKEEQFSFAGSDGKRTDRKQYPSIPAEVTSSDSRSTTGGSTVSAITMYSSEASSDLRMMKASKDLLAILQSNNFAAFDAKPKKTLYEA
jgi:hypothetical protein